VSASAQPAVGDVANFREEARGVLACDIYSRQECDALVERLTETANCWAEASVSRDSIAGGYEEVVDAEVRRASVARLDAVGDILADFEGRIDQLMRPDLEQLWAPVGGRYEGTQLIRYRPGGHYHGHTDSGGLYDQRFFTVVAYLNDNFTGGETSFPSLAHAVRPKRGRAIAFPAAYFHCAEPVGKGEKFVLVTWLCRPAAIRWM
jgi:Rps23 Pro-64 3,4-dihydroxylase Tpa1-like proline 4-hydroxylase